MNSESDIGRSSETDKTAEKQDGFVSPEVAYRVRPKMVRAARPGRTDKLKRLINYLLDIDDQKFTGYIKVNYSQGSIGRIEKFEEILSKEA
jgi:hypothetical protein